MLPKKLKGNEAGTIGLPIRITVLSIIGFIGFYAILSALGSALLLLNLCTQQQI